MFRFINFCFFLSILSCVSPRSFEDYAYAQMALDAAKKASASRHSPAYFNKARSQMNLGMLEFKNNNYDDANEHFQNAQKFAEQAELISFIKKSFGGELY